MRPWLPLGPELGSIDEPPLIPRWIRRRINTERQGTSGEPLSRAGTLGPEKGRWSTLRGLLTSSHEDVGGSLMDKEAADDTSPRTEKRVSE